MTFYRTQMAAQAALNEIILHTTNKAPTNYIDSSNVLFI